MAVAALYTVSHDIQNNHEREYRCCSPFLFFLHFNLQSIWRTVGRIRFDAIRYYTIFLCINIQFIWLLLEYGKPMTIVAECIPNHFLIKCNPNVVSVSVLCNGAFLHSFAFSLVNLVYDRLALTLCSLALFGWFFLGFLCSSRSIPVYLLNNIPIKWLSGWDCMLRFYMPQSLFVSITLPVLLLHSTRYNSTQQYPNHMW